MYCKTESRAYRSRYARTRTSGDDARLTDLAPAMAYVPWHSYEKPYDEAKGFSRGTMYPSLDLPFTRTREVK